MKSTLPPPAPIRYVTPEEVVNDPDLAETFGNATITPPPNSICHDLRDDLQKTKQYPAESVEKTGSRDR